jgi:hypothetical protein
MELCAPRLVVSKGTEKDKYVKKKQRGKIINDLETKFSWRL